MLILNWLEKNKELKQQNVTKREMLGSIVYESVDLSCN